MIKVHQYLRWLGAKYKVLDTLISNMPKTKVNFFAEPFCGSAIVYVNMKINNLVDKGILNDVGKWIILSHKLIRDDLDYYKEESKKYINAISKINKDLAKFKEYYYAVRKSFNECVDRNDESNEQIMRFIFLSKMGFNGVIRFNKKGHSNTPPGHQNLGFSFNDNSLIEFSQQLKFAKLSTRDYASFLDVLRDKLTSEDMIFYDPPYLPTNFDINNKEKSFGNYFNSDFNYKDIEKIKEYFDLFSKNGVKQMLTINDISYIRELFSKYNIIENTVFKLKKNAKSGNTKELIIKNY